jgi:hypothetical protein
MAVNKSEVFATPIVQPQWFKVVSENLQHIFYDDENQILYVQFYGSPKSSAASTMASGSIYRYFFVPRGLYDNMVELNKTARMTSGRDEKTDENSIGHWFNNHIRVRSVPAEKWSEGGSYPYAYQRVSK